MSCGLAWAAVVGAWVPMLSLVRRAGLLRPFPPARGDASRVRPRDAAAALGFGVAAMTAALVLVAAMGC